MTQTEITEYCKELGLTPAEPLDTIEGRDLPGKAREVLELTIKEKTESYLFFTNIASRISDEPVAHLLYDIARDELKHKALLETVKYDEPYVYEASFTDCYLDEALREKMPPPATPVQKALLLAIQWEQASLRLYLNLADRVKDTPLRRLLLGISQEEAVHKRQLKAEYIISSTLVRERRK